MEFPTLTNFTEEFLVNGYSSKIKRFLVRLTKRIAYENVQKQVFYETYKIILFLCSQSDRDGECFEIIQAAFKSLLLSSFEICEFILLGKTLILINDLIAFNHQNLQDLIVGIPLLNVHEIIVDFIPISSLQRFKSIFFHYSLVFIETLEFEKFHSSFPEFSAFFFEKLFLILSEYSLFDVVESISILSAMAVKFNLLVSADVIDRVYPLLLHWIYETTRRLCHYSNDGGFVGYKSFKLEDHMRNLVHLRSLVDQRKWHLKTTQQLSKTLNFVKENIPMFDLPVSMQASLLFTWNEVLLIILNDTSSTFPAVKLTDCIHWTLDLSSFHICLDFDIARSISVINSRESDFSDHSQANLFSWKELSLILWRIWIEIKCSQQTAVDISNRISSLLSQVLEGITAYRRFIDTKRQAFLLALAFITFSFRLCKTSNEDTIKQLPLSFFRCCEEASILIYQNLNIGSVWKFPFTTDQECRNDVFFASISAAFNLSWYDNRTVFLYFSTFIFVRFRHYFQLDTFSAENIGISEENNHGDLLRLLSTFAMINDFNMRDSNNSIGTVLEGIFKCAQPLLIKECGRGNHHLVALFYNCWKRKLANALSFLTTGNPKKKSFSRVVLYKKHSHFLGGKALNSITTPLDLITIGLFQSIRTLIQEINLLSLLNSENNILVEESQEVFTTLLHLTKVDISGLYLVILLTLDQLLESIKASNSLVNEIISFIQELIACGIKQKKIHSPLMLELCGKLLSQCMMQKLFVVNLELENSTDYLSIQEVFGLISKADMLNFIRSFHLPMMQLSYYFKLLSKVDSNFENAFIFYFSSLITEFLHDPGDKNIAAYIEENSILLEDTCAELSIGKKYSILLIRTSLMEIIKHWLKSNGSSRLSFFALRHMERFCKFSRQSFFARNGSSILIAVYFLLLEDRRHDVIAVLRTMIQEFKEHKIPLPKQSPLFSLLTSSYLQTKSVQEVVNSRLLPNCLNAISQVLSISILPSDSQMNSNVLYKFILPLIWNLGDFEFALNGAPIYSESYHCSLQALRILSLLISYETLDSLNNISNLEEEWKIRLASLIKSEFLFISSRLFQNNWNQARSLKCLSAIIPLIAHADLHQFLPKILSLIDEAINAGEDYVRLSATHVIRVLCQILSPEVIEANFVFMLISVFPLWEREIVGAKDTEIITIVDPRKLETRDYLEQFPECCLVSDYEFFDVRKRSTLIQRKICIETFLRLHSEQPNSFDSVLYFPIESDLLNIRRAMLERRRSKSLEELLPLCSKFFDHQSLHVRRVAVKGCLQTLKERKQDFYQVLQENQSSVNEMSICSKLVRELIELLIREVSCQEFSKLRKCLVIEIVDALGEIGCLDSSYISKEIMSCEHYSTPRRNVPWAFSDVDFGIFLLLNFFIPSFKSAQESSSQDFPGMGIQEILRVLAQRVTNAKSLSELPTLLTSKLSGAQILDVVKPFFGTKYIFKEAHLTKSLPIYFHGISRNEWIGSYVKFLLTVFQDHLTDFSASSFPFVQLYGASSPLVRFNSTLCQFLVPHLLLDLALMTVEAKDRKKKALFESYLLSALEELLKVLVSVEKSGISDGFLDKSFEHSSDLDGEARDKCLNSIFEFLDTLQYWAAECLDLLRRGIFPEINKDSIYSNLQSTFLAINKIVNFFPIQVLAKAAFQGKLYTRSLFCSELESRNVFRVAVENSQDSNYLISPFQNNARDQSAQRNLLSNDGIKLKTYCVNELQMDLMLKIFGTLEENDSLQGLSLIRRNFGSENSYQHRLLELRLSDDWLNKLLEYELLQNCDEYQNFAHVAYDDCAESTITNSSGRKKIGRMIFQPDRLIRQQNLRQERALVMNRVHNNVFSLDDINEIERGKLNCLIQLGHLNTVITNTFGKLRNPGSLANVTLPYGIEAAWRLCNWENLDSLLHCVDHSFQAPTHFVPFSEPDQFRIQLGRLVQSVHVRHQAKFKNDLVQAKIAVATSLSYSPVVSYSLYVPYLSHIHLLQELEQGAKLLQIVRGTASVSSVEKKEEIILSRWKWNERFLFSSDSVIHKLQLLALRRFLFTENELPNLVQENWFQSFVISIEQGYLESAKYSLHQLKKLPNVNEDRLLLRECQLLSYQKKNLLAIGILEPRFIDLHLINNLLKYHKFKQTGSKSKTKKKFEEFSGNEEKFLNLYKNFIENESNRAILAEKIFIGSKLMIDSQLLNGKNILERFSTVLRLAPGSDVAYLEYAKYCEYLFNDLSQKEEAYSLHNGAATSAAKHSGNSVLETVLFDEDTADDRSRYDQVFQTPGFYVYRYIEKAIEKYGECIRLSQNYNILIEVLPKFLTLWLGFTGQQEFALQSQNKSNKAAKNPLTILQDLINEKISKIIDDISPTVWYISITQIASRVLHPNPGTTTNLEKLLSKIILAFPKQSIWHIASLMYSLNKERKLLSRKILNATYKKLANEARSEKDSVMLLDSQKLFSQLISLAAFQTKDKKTIFKLENISNIHEFLIPTNSVLIHSSLSFPMNKSIEFGLGSTFAVNSSTFKSSSSSAVHGLTSSILNAQVGSSHQSSNFMFINYFHEQVSVAASKAKPKTLVIESKCGKKIKFLCKMEKDGDLRKDAHLMEFNSTVNRLLIQNVQSRKRKLRLRTYAVVCLNEECGLLEWVNNTECLRQAISDSHMYYNNPLILNTTGGADLIQRNLLKPPPNIWPAYEENTFNATTIYPYVTYREVYQAFVDFQAKFEDDIAGMTKAYQALIHEVFRYIPCFHRWFIEKFDDSSLWLEARTTYTRSSAVWSAVGYIIGLGDRHTENILLDTTTGECVHVDFDCLFDKGLSLAKPEIVPFRLTSNMIDAMGVSGIEGPYRQTLEVCLTVLRENREKLLNILEPFLRDPTVVWNRSGRAQRSSESTASTSTNNPKESGSKVMQDMENKEAKEMLHKISERLKGVYNIIHPHREKFVRGALKREEPLPTRGLGPSKEELLPLSVSGQTQRLIEEATAYENLAQLYIGWQPWL